MLATQRTNVFKDSETAFVEVAVPLHVRQTFTYRLPSAWRKDVRLGARLLVPFGRKQLTIRPGIFDRHGLT